MGGTLNHGVLRISTLSVSAQPTYFQFIVVIILLFRSMPRQKCHS